MSFSEQTFERFAREVAKYPADQKASAVMACLAIVQDEQGFVSIESEDAIKEVARQVGYSDQFFFSKDFKKMTKLTPTQFREQERQP